MTSRVVTANRWVFFYFTFHLLLLQFTPDGLHAYFSMYVLRRWFFSGYFLYAALIHLFAVYSLALFQKKQFVTGVMQLLSLVVLIGVMLFPFYSLDHVSLLPFLAALEPVILFSDYHSSSSGDLHDVHGTIWRSVIILIFLTPVIIVLLISPIVEKIIIYSATALTFARLQSKLRDSGGAQRASYITG